MDLLLTMNVFRRVVELRSFSATARDLRLSNAAVSKYVALLEERLRVRLLHRTTRRVTPTAPGEAYYRRCIQILEDVTEAEEVISQPGATPRGLLRVNVPLSFGQMHVVPLIPEILHRWPELKLELALNDRFVDLVEEGVDIAIRIADTLPDSASLVAQRLARTRRVLCASPRYLRTHGTPRAPADLARFNCIDYTLSRTRGHWSFAGADGPVQVPVKGNLEASNSLAIRDAVLGDVGISLLPLFYVQPWLRRKQLRELLPDYSQPNLFVTAVYARQRHLSAKLRAVVELLRERFGRAPWAVADSLSPGARR